MSSPSRTRGIAMMVIGPLMIMATVPIAVLTGDPLPVAFGAIGIGFIGVAQGNDETGRGRHNE